MKICWNKVVQSFGGSTRIWEIKLEIKRVRQEVSSPDWRQTGSELTRVETDKK